MALALVLWLGGQTLMAQVEPAYAIAATAVSKSEFQKRLGQLHGQVGWSCAEMSEGFGRTHFYAQDQSGRWFSVTEATHSRIDAMSAPKEVRVFFSFKPRVGDARIAALLETLAPPPEKVSPFSPEYRATVPPAKVDAFIERWKAFPEIERCDVDSVTF